MASAPPRPDTACLLVAAGSGLRAGGGIPKQWRDLGGRSVADRSLAAFASHPAISQVLAVIRPDDDAALRWAAAAGLRWVPGGATRAASVRAGLEALDGQADRVLIHDVARPLVSAALIARVAAALDEDVAAAPAVAVVDALWTAEGHRVTGIRDRTGLWRAQTPQGFRLDAILAAHRAFDGDAADDVAVALAAGLDVALVPGDEDNLKITTEQDFPRALRLLRQMTDIRTGNGVDVHRFGPGDHVTLAGVRVPHDRGLVGHSDADVGLHAVTDAIYGALAEGDIGRHFPPSDPQWRGADSALFLDHAAALARERGYALSNIDLTLICERPKIGAHARAMADRIAAIAATEPGRVSVKATTTERLGFAGREEGIAAIATVTLVAR